MAADVPTADVLAADVLVIGAGLAGLQTAVSLAEAGRSIVVLESRDRVGGRVWSHRFDNGQWCERGAEFIDSTHTSVLQLAADLGLRLTSVRGGRDDTKRLLDVGGRTAPFALHHSLGDDLARWADALAGLAAQVDPEHPDASPDAARLDALPLSALIADLGLGLMARVVIGREVRTEYMVGPDEVSQLMAGWMTALHLAAGEGREAHRIAGGNDQLATGLAAQLTARAPDALRLSTPVALVEPDDGAAVLADGQRLTAATIVATVPLPVLGRIWPDMPVALARVGYGIGGKVSVQVGRRVWRDQGRDGSVHSERAWGEMWETSDDQPGDTGVLTALLSSHDGAALAALPDTANRVVEEADRIFPGLQGLAGERVQTDWTNDRSSLGAYVTFGPGQLVDAWPLLHQRHGRMLLAGEHTDPFSGYMEGALRSATRVVTELLG